MASSSSTTSSLSLSAAALHHLITVVSVKLNLTNYLVRRMQILPLIESLKVKDLITEGLPEEVETGDKGKTDSKYDDLREKDLLLRSWITGTLSKEVLYMVVGCTTTKQI